MSERVYRTEALVLRRSDLGEADRLLVLATPGGKRRVTAKGARKTTSRLAGHIELFAHATLLLAVGRTFDIVTQSQVIHSFTTLRSDLGRLTCAYYVAELYDRWTQEEEEENRPLFDLLVQTLIALDTTARPSLVLRSFELRLLHMLGYRPHLQRCAVCQEPLTESADRFSPALGGVLCRRDAPADRTALPMSLGAFKLLRFLQAQPLPAIELLAISPETRAEVAGLLRAYMARLLERDLKSAAFLEMVPTE
jgi:DNA repair protein RecO (recombination protein O)